VQHYDLTPTLPRPKSLSRLYNGKTRLTLRRGFGSTFPGPGKIGINIPAEHHEKIRSLDSAEIWDFGRISLSRADIIRDELQQFAPLIARKHFVPFHADMIPRTSFGASLANLLTSESWKAVRKPYFKAAGYVCQICGEGNGAVEGHEVWKFHDGRIDGNGWGTQSLETILCLCNECHQMFHIGLGSLRGQSKAIQERVRAINEWTTQDYRTYAENCVRQYNSRSRRNWILDLTQVATSSHLTLKTSWRMLKDGKLSAQTTTGRTETRLKGISFHMEGKQFSS
jgi:hypothetical protein